MKDDLARLLARPIAHRGLHGCGKIGPVENSIGAARAAAAAGYGIECDIQLSLDGEAIVFHDDDLNRLTGRPGRLIDFDAVALCALPLLGSLDRLSTLAELLGIVAGRVPLVVEIKARGDGDTRLADRALALFEDYSGPVALESFDPAIVRHCLARTLRRPIGLVGPAESGDDLDPALLDACDFVSWSIDDLASFVMRHPALPRSTWTVRTPSQVSCATQLGAQIVFEGLQV